MKRKPRKRIFYKMDILFKTRKLIINITGFLESVAVLKGTKK
jgi:hypothetical protein